MLSGEESLVVRRRVNREVCGDNDESCGRAGAAVVGARILKGRVEVGVLPALERVVECCDGEGG